MRKTLSNSWSGPERRKKDRRKKGVNGRRAHECPMHQYFNTSDPSQTMAGLSLLPNIGAKLDSSVSLKLFFFFIMAAMVIVGSGFGWFGNDLLKVKEAQIAQIKAAADQAEKTAISIAAIQKEIAVNLLESQRETRNQIEKITSQLDAIARIQAVTANEITTLKKYDEMERQEKLKGIK